VLLRELPKMLWSEALPAPWTPPFPESPLSESLPLAGLGSLLRKIARQSGPSLRDFGA
jgi:hypothetical protein